MLPANRLCAAPSPLFFAFVRRIIGEDRQFAVPSWQFGLTKLSKLHRRPRVHLVARSRYVNNILDFNFHICNNICLIYSFSKVDDDVHTGTARQDDWRIVSQPHRDVSQDGWTIRSHGNGWFGWRYHKKPSSFKLGGLGDIVGSSPFHKKAIRYPSNR